MNKNSQLIQPPKKQSLPVAMVFLLASLWGCAGKKINRGSSDISKERAAENRSESRPENRPENQAENQNDTYGPVSEGEFSDSERQASDVNVENREEEESSKQSSDFDPQPLEAAAGVGARWVLVVGPGLGRSNALVGILSELEKKKVNLSAIVATEFSAFWAILYASSKNANEFLWRVKKIGEANFDTVSEHLKSKTENTWKRKLEQRRLDRKFENILDENFNLTTFDKLRVPVYVSLQDAETGEVYYLSRGPVKKALRCALARDGVLSTCSLQEKSYWSADKKEPFPLSFSRGLQKGRILAVDFLTTHPNGSAQEFISKEYGSILEEYKHRLEYSDQILAPPLDRAELFDFSQRTHAEFRGKLEVDKVLPALK